MENTVQITKIHSITNTQFNTKTHPQLSSKNFTKTTVDKYECTCLNDEIINGSYGQQVIFPADKEDKTASDICTKEKEKEKRKEKTNSFFYKFTE